MRVGVNSDDSPWSRLVPMPVCRLTNPPEANRAAAASAIVRAGLADGLACCRRRCGRY